MGQLKQLLSSCLAGQRSCLLETGKCLQVVTLLEEYIQLQKHIMGLDDVDTLSLCSALAIWREEAEEGEWEDVDIHEEDDNTS